MKIHIKNGRLIDPKTGAVSFSNLVIAGSAAGSRLLGDLVAGGRGERITADLQGAASLALSNLMLALGLTAIAALAALTVFLTASELRARASAVTTSLASGTGSATQTL